MRVIGGSYSDIGIYRKDNQDRIMYDITMNKGAAFATAAICDGVGGAERGEVAAQIVIDGVEDWHRSISSWIDPKHDNCDIIFSHLKDAAEEWNTEVRVYCAQHEVIMATTMSVLMIVKDEYRVLHVGDSRVYKYNGKLEILTEDEKSPESKGGSIRQVLRNYMGKDSELSFRQYKGKVGMGDLFFICSDGFYHRFSSEDAGEIYKECRRSGNLSQVANKWVHTMEERGDRDNISLALMHIR